MRKNKSIEVEVPAKPEYSTTAQQAYYKALSSVHTKLLAYINDRDTTALDNFEVKFVLDQLRAIKSTITDGASVVDGGVFRDIDRLNHQVQQYYGSVNVRSNNVSADEKLQQLNDEFNIEQLNKQAQEEIRKNEQMGGRYSKQLDEYIDSLREFEKVPYYRGIDFELQDRTLVQQEKKSNVIANRLLERTQI
ncbi:hypothetical protein ACSAHR_00555 [Pediococcus pentosaceus]|jgi:hypothetical protein|uniref:hypothetical protein n=1 Tax=Pediococcus pentosaceus TaxID=1255 RepID=UPI001049FFFC|nr:hypothetical protein [Pediococcus pentosaceus]KAF0467869.1 hypothetical protein GBP05_02805 [Pediococcus pentosaceus]MBF7108869.1 hypothetical protein [Pediococcus pentosaceus]MBF7121003.1 hypothetical protein [Pediococcus pentosaceus]MCD5257354.1 hypothetical protein [Pediococcus pentosaceus]MCH4015883.1 hypothetical protein [Pediococcus pentosaceus]